MNIQTFRTDVPINFSTAQKTDREINPDVSSRLENIAQSTIENYLKPLINDINDLLKLLSEFKLPKEKNKQAVDAKQEEVKKPAVEVKPLNENDQSNAILKRAGEYSKFLVNLTKEISCRGLRRGQSADIPADLIQFFRNNDIKVTAPYTTLKGPVGIDEFLEYTGHSDGKGLSHRWMNDITNSLNKKFNW